MHCSYLRGEYKVGLYELLCLLPLIDWLVGYKLQPPSVHLFK